MILARSDKVSTPEVSMRARKFRSFTTCDVFLLAASAALMWCLPAEAQTDVKVSLNAPYDGSNAAFFLADEKGYYAGEGLRAALDPSGGSGEVATRIGSGTYDFGFGDINVLM
jgi:ABC-type nitrate/sulfonate/bicarbonate transport system substrate-binding protein